MAWLFILVPWVIVIPLCLILGLIMFFVYRQIAHARRQAELVRTTRTSSVGDLSRGLRKIKGRIVAQEGLLRSPLTNTRCVYYHFVVKEARSSGGRRGGTHQVTIVDDKRAIDVTVQDDTGEADVHLEDAEVRMKRFETASSGLFRSATPEVEEVLRRRYSVSSQGLLFNRALSYFECVLCDGDEVMVVGDVEMSSRSPLFHKGPNTLIVTDMNDAQVKRSYGAQGVFHWVILGFLAFIMLAFLGGAAVFSVIGMIALKSLPPSGVPVPKPTPRPTPLPKPWIGPQPAPKDERPSPLPINPAWNEAVMVPTYLSDLPEFDVRVGWGRFGKNGMLGHGRQPGEADTPILVNGQRHAKALSTIPVSFSHAQVSYRLGRDYKLFRCRVALGDVFEGEPQPKSPATFEVYGDGRLLWASPTTQTPGRVYDCRLGVEGVEMLQLRVRVPGDMGYVRATWIDPAVLK